MLFNRSSFISYILVRESELVLTPTLLLFMIPDHYTGVVWYLYNASIVSHISQVKSEDRKVSRVSLAGNAGPVKLSSLVFTTARTAKNTFLCTIPSLYFLQVICYIVHWGHSSQLSSHLHFGQTRDCGDMRSAKDQQEPPLPSPGIEEQQKGHQTKDGPSVSRWLLSLLPSLAP